MVGYAIEQAFDDVWAKNNAQENALNEVKTEFLKKTAALYPECNMIFKFESEFREMGSSGNVFIYLKGTASVGDNKGMEEVKIAVIQPRRVAAVSLARRVANELGEQGPATLHHGRLSSCASFAFRT